MEYAASAHTAEAAQAAPAEAAPDVAASLVPVVPVVPDPPTETADAGTELRLAVDPAASVADTAAAAHPAALDRPSAGGDAAVAEQRQRRLRTLLAPLHREKDIAAFVVEQRQILLDEIAPVCRARGPAAGRLWMQAYSDLIDAVLRRLFALARERVATAATVAASAASEGSVALSLPTPSPVAVLATGGYGQRLLAPHSDLDITFLADRTDADPPVLRELFRLVMDVLMVGARLKVGYAYRTPDDVGGEAVLLATLDHQTQTALLDARLIVGDAALFARFDRGFRAHLQTADFLFRKQAERQGRREKYGATPLVAEPQLKEGAGGLRDVQTAGWMARVRFARSTGGDTSYAGLWRELVRRRVLTEEERVALLRDRDLLLFMRCLLHRTAGERRDALTRPRQDRIAEMLAGDGDSVENGGEEIADLATPDGLMAAYYAAATRIYQISDKVVTRCLDAPLALGEDSGLSAVRRTVALTDPTRAATDPIWPMQALAHCQTYGLTLALPTEEAVQRYCAQMIESPHAESEEARSARTAAGAAFLDLLGRPGDVGATLRQMLRVGLLNWLLPEFTACLSVLPGDPSHVYTVGEHSLRVMENLNRLRPRPPSAVGYYTTVPATLGDPTGPVEEWEEPIVGAYRELLVTLDSPATLLLAALLHDVGKQWRALRNGTRAPHAETGAERTPEICGRLGCPPAVTRRVTLLVREHLVMAETSRLRDLSLTETIQTFAQQVGDRETLRMLYLLTWADTAAVGPGMWTPMKARQLAELFDRTDALLAAEEVRHGESAASEAAPSAAGAAALPSESEEAARRMSVVRERVRRQLAREGERSQSAREVTPEAIYAFTEAMPAVYLLNTPPSVMALHLDMAARLEAATRNAAPEEDPIAARRPVIDMRNPSPAGEGGGGGPVPAATATELIVVAWDEPGLLAKITGVLLAFDINIHGVQAFTRDFAEADGEAEHSSPRRIIIDTLSIDHRDRPLPALKRADVEEALVRVLSGEQPLQELLVRRSRVVAPSADGGGEAPPIARRVRLIDDTSGGGRFTLIDLEVPDEPGVVYRCASRFAALGWNIHSARVSAWSGSVRCAFYVSGPDGAPIPAAVVRERLAPVPA